MVDAFARFSRSLSRVTTQCRQWRGGCTWECAGRRGKARDCAVTFEREGGICSYYVWSVYLQDYNLTSEWRTDCHLCDTLMKHIKSEIRSPYQPCENSFLHWPVQKIQLPPESCLICPWTNFLCRLLKSIFTTSSVQPSPLCDITIPQHPFSLLRSRSGFLSVTYGPIMLYARLSLHLCQEKCYSDKL